MKTLKEQSDEYVNDQKWKRVKRLCYLMKYEEANVIANSIIDSYPEIVRREAGTENTIKHFIKRFNMDEEEAIKEGILHLVW